MLATCTSPPDPKGKLIPRALNAHAIKQIIGRYVLPDLMEQLNVKVLQQDGAKGSNLAAGKEAAGTCAFPHPVGNPRVRSPRSDKFAAGSFVSLPVCLFFLQVVVVMLLSALQRRSAVGIICIFQESVSPEAVERFLASACVPVPLVHESRAGGH